MERARILIVEDEPLIAEDLAAMLVDLGHVVCARAHDALSALAAAQRERPDLVLLDIQLVEGNDGIYVAQALQELHIPYIYVTSHTDPITMARVASTRPEGFVIKPFEEDDLRTQLVVAFARAHLPLPAVEREEGADLVVRDKGRLVKVPINAIRYIEADNNYVVVHTGERRYVISSTLSALEERLRAPYLVRIHRGYVVDVRRITALREREAQLNDRVLPVGRTHRSALVKRWLALRSDRVTVVDPSSSVVHQPHGPRRGEVL
jgi:two-component system, LytTR family, response regulator LytT